MHTHRIFKVLKSSQFSFFIKKGDTKFSNKKHTVIQTLLCNLRMLHQIFYWIVCEVSLWQKGSICYISG